MATMIADNHNLEQCNYSLYNLISTCMKCVDIPPAPWQMSGLPYNFSLLEDASTRASTILATCGRRHRVVWPFS